MTTRQFKDVTIKNAMWAEATGEVLTGAWEIEEQTGYFANGLGHLAINGEGMSIDDLKAARDEAGDLSKEVFEATDGDIESLGADDYNEAVARIIAHGALAGAYKIARNELTWRKYMPRRVWHGQRAVASRVPGMGGVESHDRERAALLSEA